MYGNRAVMAAPARQIDGHGPVSRHSVMRMVNFPDQCFYCFFPGMISCLPVFPIVIVGIRADPQPPQQPADAEFFLMLIDEPVSL